MLAACSGQRIEEARDYRDSRWGFIVGLPLFLGERRAGRVLVGAVTVSSLVPSRSSVLCSDQAVDQRVFNELIVRNTAGWLTTALDNADTTD